MKARKKGSNYEWEEVKFVQLEGSYIFFKEEDLEFDTLSTELKTNEQINNEKHWQDVRERAAIAALSGLVANPNIEGTFEQLAQAAVGYADAIIEQLKKE